MSLARIQKFLLEGSRQLVLGFGIGSLAVLTILVLWPHSGVAGTLSRQVCPINEGVVANCSIQPAAAQITVSGDTLGQRGNPGPPTWSAKSDSGGHFHLDLAPGAYIMTAQEKGDASVYYQGQASFAVFAARTTNVDLLLLPIFPSFGLGQCLARTDLIATPDGETPVWQLRPGQMVWTVSEDGRRLAAAVLLVTHRPTPAGFHIRRVALADGRMVEASPGHPTADGRLVGGLRPGDAFDGSSVVHVEAIPYSGDTWDLLPAGPTGDYWANGVLLGSTLRGDGIGSGS